MVRSMLYPGLTLQWGIESRTEAIYHVQFELNQESIQSQINGLEEKWEFHLEGPIVRLFRGDGNLEIGDRASTRLVVYKDAFLMFFGGWSGFVPDELVTASHIEVYLHQQPPRQALGQCDFTL